MTAARVVIAEDHDLMAAAIRLALANERDFEIVADVRRGTEVLPATKRYRADVVLLDLSLPELHGFTCLELLRVQVPHVKSVVLSGFADSEHIEAALSRGAVGYIVKTIRLEELATAIRQALNGALFIPFVACDGRREHWTSNFTLTGREAAILVHLAQGKPNDAIATAEGIQPRTVKFHLTHIYRKLGIANRTEAALWAHQNGFVDDRVRADRSVSSVV
jgi:NarL family two-component system response regulator LiaR